MQKDGIKVVLERTLHSRHRPTSLLSHFEGSDEELKKLVFLAWTLLPHRRGRTSDTFVIRGVSPDKFFCKDGAMRTIYGTVKQEAGMIDLVVRISKTGRYGRVQEIELIDFQAWPIRRYTESIAA